MTEDEILELPALPKEDREIVDAYVEIGCPVDRLPYSSEFDQLMRLLGKPDNTAEKFAVYQRLVSLRKRGRIPHLLRNR